DVYKRQEVMSCFLMQTLRAQLLTGLLNGPLKETYLRFPLCRHTGIFVKHLQTYVAATGKSWSMLEDLIRRRCGQQ
ncbi:Unknown protein sequence, partial [Pseudomonas syringae pv. coryli]